MEARGVAKEANVISAIGTAVIFVGRISKCMPPVRRAIPVRYLLHDMRAIMEHHGAFQNESHESSLLLGRSVWRSVATGWRPWFIICFYEFLADATRHNRLSGIPRLAKGRRGG